jgi:sugar phosphate isomerase/epimerase
MKLSSQEHIVPGESFLDRLKYLRDCGIQGVELTLGDQGVMLGSLRHRVDEILDGCTSTGVAPSIITTKVFDLLDVDPAKRQSAMNEVRDALDVAARVGALGVCIVPRFGPPSLPDLSPLATAWDLEHQLFVLEIKELAQQAERLGVCIVLEPLHRYLVKFLRTVGHAKRICEEVGSPALRILVDNFQIYNEEVTVEGAIRLGGDLVAHVHISDNNRRLPPQGSTDFVAIISALRDIGYRGFLSFECDVAGAPLEPQFREATQCMKNLLIKAGVGL